MIKIPGDQITNTMSSTGKKDQKKHYLDCCLLTLKMIIHPKRYISKLHMYVLLQTILTLQKL